MQEIQAALISELEAIQSALEDRGGLHVLAVRKDKKPYGKGNTPGVDENKKLGRANHPGDPRLCWNEVVYKGALPAIVPGASNLVCVDIDKGDANKLWKDDKLKPLFWVKTHSFGDEKKTGLHFYYDHPQDEEIRNAEWSLNGCKGDIRGDRGYAVIWDRPDFLRKIQGINGKHRPLPKAFMKSPPVKPATVENQRLIGEARGYGDGVARVAAAPQGERNNTLNVEVFRAAKLGKLDAAMEAAFYSAARARGLEESEIKATIESARSAGERERIPSSTEIRNTQQRVRNTPKASAPKEPEPEPEPTGPPVETPVAKMPEPKQQVNAATLRYPKTVEAFASILAQMNIDVRFDDRDSAIYLKMSENYGDADIPVDEWVRQTDNLDAKLKAVIARKYDNWNGTPWMISISKWQEYLLAIAPIVDPVKIWLEQLPAWDGKPRLDTLISDSGMVPVVDKKDDVAEELIKWASRAVPMTATYRTLYPGAEVEEMVVLIGEQDWGKSTYAKLLVPEERFHGDQLSFASPPKEQVESTLGKLIIEVSEMAGTNRAETTDIKRFLTRKSDEMRLAYMRSPSRRPRRFALIGTSNENVLPNDPTGNRRFVAVELSSGDPAKVREYLGREGMLEQIYAEALHRIEEGETPRLDKELKATQREINEDFRRTDPMEEEIRQVLPTMPPFFTPSRMAMRLNMIEKGDVLEINKSRRLAQAMRAVGVGNAKRYYCRDRVQRRLYDNRKYCEKDQYLFDDETDCLPMDYEHTVDKKEDEPI